MPPPRKPSRPLRPLPGPAGLSTELLVLPDGRILVHNLTPAFAAVLNELNPADEAIKLRANEPRTCPASPTSPHELRPGT
jgi:hypothetical protein